MRFNTLLLTMIAASCVGYVVYDRRSRPAMNGTHAPHRAFPVERVLTDRTGRTVAVRLLSQSATEVQFVRQSDGSVFRYPLESLSELDRAFLRDFPVTSIAAPNVAAPRRSPGPPPPGDHLRHERAELQHKIALLRLEQQKQNDKSPTLSRDQVARRIDECRNRIVEIDKLLLDLAFRNQH